MRARTAHVPYMRVASRVAEVLGLFRGPLAGLGVLALGGILVKVSRGARTDSLPNVITILIGWKR